VESLVKLYRFVFLFALIAAPVVAQDRTDAVAQAKAELQRNHVDLSGACGAAKITNLVAWNLRPQYGLLGKLGGYRAVLRPDGSCESGGAPTDSTREAGVASDYLIERGTWQGYDLLEDAGGRSGPRWAHDVNEKTGLADPVFLARNANNYIEPIDPAAYMGTPPAPPVVVPPPVVVTPGQPPAPPQVFDAAALSAQIAQLQLSLDTHVRGLGEAIASVNDNVSAGRAENRSAWAKVADHWKSIVMIASPAASWWIARVTGNKAQ
jgi:hypothetical protein